MQPYLEKTKEELKEEVKEEVKSVIKNDILEQIIKTGFNQEVVTYLEKIMTVAILSMEKCIEQKKIENYYTAKNSIKAAIKNYKLFIKFLFAYISIILLSCYIGFALIVFLVSKISLISQNPSLTTFTDNTIFVFFTIVAGYFSKENWILIFNMKKFIIRYVRQIKFLDYKATQNK